MDSGESYNINEDRSEDSFDPEDSERRQLRGRRNKNHHYNVAKDTGPNNPRRNTRGVRNANISQYARDEQEDVNDQYQYGRKVIYDQNDQFAELDNQDQKQETQQIASIFEPDIDQILWKKDRQPGIPQYLIKLKGRSYLHVQWLLEHQVLNISKSAKNKLNRFNKNFEKKLLDGTLEESIIENKYFDPSYLQVDRILTCTEIFPVVHHKKANQIKNKWTQSIMIICSKLLNFTKENIHYGVFFSEPVNPERDNCPNYKKVILQPMDLGTILNRVYLDFYKTPIDFWKDIGLVWKNCRKFNQEENSDIKALGQTLRECSIYLYKQWHELCTERYNEMMKQFNIVYENRNKQILNQQENKKIQIENQQVQLNVEKEQGNHQKSRDPMQIQNGNDEKEIAQNQEEEHETQKMIIKSPSNGQSEQIQKPIQKAQSQQKLEGNISSQKSVKSKKSQSLQQQSINKGQDQKLLNQIQNQLEQNIIDQQLPQEKLITPERENDVVESQAGQSDKQSQHKLNQKQFKEDNVNNNKDSSDNDNQNEKEEQVSQVLCNNIFIERRKVELPSNIFQVQKFNPGPFSYEWIIEEGETEQKYTNYNYEILDDNDLKQLNLNREVDKLYFIKWKGLSYSCATWQLESQIGANDKINDYKNFNRALDKETRKFMLEQNERHKNLLEVEYLKKKSKYSNNAINQMRNKLYNYDIKKFKEPIHYSHSSPPIYKDLKRLRDYQLETLNWLIYSWYHKRNTILADEMGLGKTIQSIAFLNHLYNIEGSRGPFLIVVPLSTLEHWKRTVEQWTNLNCVVYHDNGGIGGRSSLRYYEWYYTDISTKGTVLSATELYKFTILIVSYEVVLQDFQNILISIPFQYIVIDQAHRLKNQNAKILTYLKQLPCKRILLLTGTPIQNNTDQLWSLLNFIERDKFNSLEDFRYRFGDLNTSQQLNGLHSLLKPYILRRMKEDVEQSIPPLKETIIDIEMTTVQKTIYRALYERNKGMLLKGFSNNAITTSLNNLEMQLRKCCNHPFLIKEMQVQLIRDCKTEEQRINKLLESSGKVTLVDKLLQKYRKQQKKVLIFSQFTYMLVLLEQYLKFKGYKYEKIDGQVKSKDRQNAIDRYNNPAKKRQVFLLSTKAGGIGINLTSANVVIIFDSDWNPQNDVQATARAHRIGQENQVQVYRLITTKTYESEMFERSMKKLGLDQAVFMGGNFNQTDRNEKRRVRTDIDDRNTKLTKQETEVLLKRGILGLLEDKNMQGNSFFEHNIEEILANNSRVANYSMIGGVLNMSKSTFVSAGADQELKMNDPNFWNIVLNNIESRTQKLLKLFDDADNYKTADGQKKIMHETSECVNTLIESKLSSNGYNGDDQNNISIILTNIMNIRSFNKHYRDMASTWLEETNKPSRRFKKISAMDLDIYKKQKIKIKEEIGQGGVVERVYVDSEELSEQHIYEDANHTKNKLIETKKQEYMKKVLCYLCEKPKCSFYCQSFCKRGFHQVCKDLVEAGVMNIDGPPDEKEDLYQLTLQDDQLKKIANMNYTCKDCSSNLVLCFVCKKKGKYFGAEYQKNKKEKLNVKLVKKMNPNPDLEEGQVEDVLIENVQTQNINNHNNNGGTVKSKNQVTKCSTANCARFFHSKCIEVFEGRDLFKYIDQKSLHFRCSLHYCIKCSGSGDTQQISQCLRCPRALHIRCMDKNLVTKINKRYIICEKHKMKRKEQIIKKGEKQTILKKLIKSNKVERKLKQRNSEELIESVSQQVIRRDHQSLYPKRTRSLLKKEIKVPIINIKPTENKKVMYTYPDFNIVPPYEFDYTQYKSDWCRYCGSRFSSNFTQGPWGPKTLCTVHYINWKKKKTLKLDEYAETRPVQPINPRDDQELKYMSTLKSKDPDVQFILTMQDGADNPKKKRKLNDLNLE